MMKVGHFYFLEDSYFTDFPDPNLERNKETINGVLHGRPCYYSILDHVTRIFWMIPISSKIEKFRKIYQGKVIKNGNCDTIVFGYVLGHEKAFLIQNICPVIPKYVNCEYIDKISNTPVSVDGGLEKELFQKSARVLALARQGKRVVFPNILWIEEELKKQIGI
jgi:hypothetical protein